MSHLKLLKHLFSIDRSIKSGAFFAWQKLKKLQPKMSSLCKKYLNWAVAIMFKDDIRDTHFESKFRKKKYIFFNVFANFKSNVKVSINIEPYLKIKQHFPKIKKISRLKTTNGELIKNSQHLNGYRPILYRQWFHYFMILFKNLPYQLRYCC